MDGDTDTALYADAGCDVAPADTNDEYRLYVANSSAHASTNPEYSRNINGCCIGYSTGNTNGNPNRDGDTYTHRRFSHTIAGGGIGTHVDADANGDKYA